MNKFLWKTKINTIIIFFIITIGVTTTILLIKDKSILIGRANPSNMPDKVRITNVSDSSFTVSYITSTMTFGTLSYGINNDQEKISLDDRDQLSGIIKQYKAHHITVRNLDQNTKYLFSIISAGEKYTISDNAPYTITTGATIFNKPTNQEPLSGKINTNLNKSSNDTIIYLSGQDTQVLSTTTDKNGQYIIPLNAIRTLALNNYKSFDKNQVFKILAIDSETQSTILLLASQAKQVPLVILSQSYDFTINQAPIASISGTFGFPIFTATQSANKNPQIITPKKEESFKDNRPIFKGTSNPNANIEIIINSTITIKERIKANSMGSWTYRPTQIISPGKHTVSITTPDQFGILKTITHSFTVYASGSQVSQTATPSATPIISITKNPTPTINIVVIPSIKIVPISTIAPLPTVTATISASIPNSSISSTSSIIAISGIATPAPTLILPTPKIIKKTNPLIPSVGSSTMITTSVTGFVIIAIGIFLFLITKGSAL
ncbi:MAG: Ig-like domain-containing protein [Candidatus Levybacteria bacterium]|nr:Ig-like domain-containing protein [Candidatus Levybacteria bacterium]